MGPQYRVHHGQPGQSLFSLQELLTYGLCQFARHRITAQLDSSGD
jgi:hypothetical protein